MAVRVAEIPVELPDGIDCGSCAARFRDDLVGHRGLLEIEPAGEHALRVSYDPDVCSLSCLTEVAGSIGARLASDFRHEILPVEGMDCYDCAQTIERAVERLEGVSVCSVNFPAAQLRVEYDASVAGLPERLRRQIAALGYRVPGPPSGAAMPSAAPSFVARHRHEAATAGAALLVTIGALWSVFVGHSVGTDVVYGAAILVGGWSIARAGVAALRATRRPDINLLMTIAVLGAVTIDAWLEGALVVTLFSIGEALESYAVDRARRSIAGLVALAPPTAVVVRGDEEREIDAATLIVGDLVVVRPGQSVAADGTIEDGTSALNEATITGESLPVDKGPGAMVFAGTLNGEGRLLVRVDHAPGDTTLDRIARAVTEAQAQKTPTERWVDGFARRYTPTVLAIAVLTATVPPLLGAGAFDDWFYRGLAFLILACPCALVIATPVAIVAALARASAAGAVKGGAYLEAAAELQAIAFDKTGTLTAGRPRLLDIIVFDGREPDDVLGIAASIESASEHPLARAIVDAAAERGLPLRDVASFSVTRGSGITGEIDGQAVRVGKPEVFDRRADDPQIATAVTRAQGSGHSVALVSRGPEIIGLLALGDTIRPEAPVALDRLRRAGVEHTVLLTGDHEAAAQVVARQVGIDEIRAGLLPADKVTSIAELQGTYGTVAMIGDGVNDAPALARSSLGIAMGSAGSPTAIETADVALMGDDLTKLAEFVTLAHTTRTVVRQNITVSLATKAVAAVLAFAGLLTLWLAVLADVGATLMVVANGLRLLNEHATARSPERA